MRGYELSMGLPRSHGRSRVRRAHQQQLAPGLLFTDMHIAESTWLLSRATGIHFQVPSRLRSQMSRSSNANGAMACVSIDMFILRVPLVVAGPPLVAGPPSGRPP